MTISVKARLALSADLERLWTDERFTNGHSTTDVREFIEAILWALALDGDLWRDGMRARSGRGDTWSAWAQRIYREDRPRWEPPSRKTWRCDVMLPIAKRPCGRPGVSGRVTDPNTGQWQIITRCTKHGRYSAAEFLREAALDRDKLPKPHPNRGGILPSYIRASNWPDLYRSVDSRWEPPAVGIVADDWPVMERVIGEPMPKLSKAGLRLIPGGVA